MGLGEEMIWAVAGVLWSPGLNLHTISSEVADCGGGASGTCGWRRGEVCGEGGWLGLSRY